MHDTQLVFKPLKGDSAARTYRKCSLSMHSDWALMFKARCVHYAVQLGSSSEMLLQYLIVTGLTSSSLFHLAYLKRLAGEILDTTFPEENADIEL